MKQKFAFLIHARYLEDVYKKFPFLRILPKNITLWLLKKISPVFISEIRGLKDDHGNEVQGYVGRMPIITHQMVEDRKLALEKMKGAIRVFSKKGVNLIGLGGLTSSLSRGGNDLKEAFNDLDFTTGRTYTVKTVTDYVKSVIDEFGLNKNHTKVAIVGAAGSIGSGCAEVLAGWGINNLLFIDLERKLDILVKRMNETHSRISNKKMTIQISHRISDINDSDIIIAATNAPEAVIEGVDPKPGAIIINDAQPSDVSPEVYMREDVLVIEGGVIKTPGVSVGFNFGLVEKDDSFCCLGEVLILAQEGFNAADTYVLDPAYLEKLDQVAKKLNFGITKYQNQFGYISDEKISKIKEIIKINNGVS
jgi:fatty aldehyde-generating acyl-ACP reductase